MKTKPIPDGHKRGWACKIDGEVSNAGHIEIHSQYGTLTYGLRPEGYDGWAFEQANGGGAVTLLYAFTSSRELLIGLILEDRPNMGKNPVLCVMGGFADATDADAHHTQSREVKEETGTSSSSARRLKGVSSSCNRLFIIADPSKDEGDKVFALEYSMDALEQSPLGWRVKPRYIQGKNEGKEIVFLPWRDAVQKSPDGIARGAVAQLLAEVL